MPMDNRKTVSIPENNVSIPKNERPPSMAPPVASKLQRLSPGVYRGAKGDLVNSSGRVIPRPTPPTAPPSSPSGIDGILAGSRPLGPNERGKYGIDPRDPNKYFIGPDGKLGGTLIGWQPDSKPLSELVGTLRGLTGSPQQPSADEQRLLDILAKIRF